MRSVLQARSGANDVEVRTIPQRVGLRRVALVDQRTCVAPSVGGTIITVDVVLLDGTVEHASPPSTIVKPELALRLFACGVIHRVGGKSEISVPDIVNGRRRSNVY